MRKKPRGPRPLPKPKPTALDKIKARRAALIRKGKLNKAEEEELTLLQQDLMRRLSESGGGS